MLIYVRKNGNFVIILKATCFNNNIKIGFGSYFKIVKSFSPAINELINLCKGHWCEFELADIQARCFTTLIVVGGQLELDNT